MFTQGRFNVECWSSQRFWSWSSHCLFTRAVMAKMSHFPTYKTLASCKPFCSLFVWQFRCAPGVVLVIVRCLRPSSLCWRPPRWFKVFSCLYSVVRSSFTVEWMLWIWSEGAWHIWWPGVRWCRLSSSAHRFILESALTVVMLMTQAPLHRRVGSMVAPFSNIFRNFNNFCLSYHLSPGRCFRVEVVPPKSFLYNRAGTIPEF